MAKRFFGFTPIQIAMALACAVASATLGVSDPAFARDPLLMPGKQTLYQRVLTRPDAKLLANPEDQQASATFPPFEVFYVYGTKAVAGKTFVEVGRSLQRGAEGWMQQDATIEWKQAIVLGFNNPAGRERALIFKTKEALEETLKQEDVTSRLQQLRTDAVAAHISAESPVISIEPKEFVDIGHQFYILPILQFGRIRLPSNINAKLLQIASVPATAAHPQSPSPEEALRNFRIGVTFVIDTTKSMQPYIDEVRKAITQLRDSIAGSPQADRFRFGLVAFRDNITEVPALEYVSKVVVPLDENATAAKFVDAIKTLKAATVSSVGFDEDSIAGLQTAMDGMNWEPFGGRLVILVTDASPREPGPTAAAGSLAPPQLQQLLERKKIALMTMHLKSEAGRFDHEKAEQAYKTMSVFNGRTNYFPIEGADPQVFGQQVSALASQLQALVSSAVEGRMAEAASAQDHSIQASAGFIGRAMQLSYLGSEGNAQVPDVFEGWLTDRDAIDKGAFPVTPFLLMSRNELSALRDVITKAVEIGTGAVQDGSSAEFFKRLREAVALMSVRPEAVQDAGTLGDVLGEYLKDLPYTSEIVNLTPEDWRDLSPIQERQMLDTLRSKVVALEKIHNDETKWHPLSPDAPAGEYVTTVPLSLMP